MIQLLGVRGFYPLVGEQDFLSGGFSRPKTNNVSDKEKRGQGGGGGKSTFIAIGLSAMRFVLGRARGRRTR